MARTRLLTSTPSSLRWLHLLASLCVTLALGACDSYSSKSVATTSATDATTGNAAATVACPSKDLKIFFAAFAEDPALQKAFTADIVDTAYVDMSAQPEPAEIVEALPREKLNFPVMPNRAQQQKQGLQYREVSNEGDRAVVVLEVPDTDEQLLYAFRRDACWTLVKIVDPAYANDSNSPQGEGAMLKQQCGNTEFRLSVDAEGGENARRTTLRAFASDGREKFIAAPEALKDYTAIGLSCATSPVDGRAYLVVEYGELPAGCNFCEWFHLYDTDGNLLSKNTEAVLQDETQPPGKQEYPDNRSYDALLKQLRLQHPEINYVQ